MDLTARPDVEMPWCDVTAIKDGIAALHRGNDPKQVSDARERLGRVMIIATGAAAGLGDWLHGDEGGTSHTLEEFLFAYGKGSLVNFLGKEPEKFSARATACLMAEKAFDKLRDLDAFPGMPHIGIGVTAAVATNIGRRGAELAHICLWSRDQVWTTSLFFVKGEMTRRQQSQIIEVFTLALLFKAVGLPELVINERLLPGRVYCCEKLYTARHPELFVLRPTEWRRTHGDPACLQAYVRDLKELPFIASNGASYPKDHLAQLSDDGYEGLMFVCSSIRPLHEGHRAMADVGRRNGLHPIFWLSVNHPDKGQVDEVDLLTRIQFCLGREGQYVDLSGDRAYFVDMARKFPGAKFAIGTDVLDKILDPKYGVSLQEVLHSFISCKTRLVVFARPGCESVDAILRKHGVPLELRYLFPAFPFEHHVSSSAIREATGRRWEI